MPWQVLISRKNHAALCALGCCAWTPAVMRNAADAESIAQYVTALYICSNSRAPTRLISKKQYAALSEFRFRLTRFQRFSQAAALDAGISPLQYLLLLHLRGFRRREWATIGELANRLDASHQGTVALVKRCESNGLLTKRRSTVDGRRVEIRLTARARKLVQRIASRHLDEVERLAEVFRGGGYLT